jgi:hypothetical protein
LEITVLGESVPFRVGLGSHARDRDARRRLNNPQAVSITRSTNPALMSRKVSATIDFIGIRSSLR